MRAKKRIKFFLLEICDQQTDKQTDHATWDSCSNRPHLIHCVQVHWWRGSWAWCTFERRLLSVVMCWTVPLRGGCWSWCTSERRLLSVVMCWTVPLRGGCWSWCTFERRLLSVVMCWTVPLRGGCWSWCTFERRLLSVVMCWTVPLRGGCWAWCTSERRLLSVVMCWTVPLRGGCCTVGRHRPAVVSRSSDHVWRPWCWCVAVNCCRVQGGRTGRRHCVVSFHSASRHVPCPASESHIHAHARFVWVRQLCVTLLLPCWTYCRRCTWLLLHVSDMLWRTSAAARLHAYSWDCLVPPESWWTEPDVVSPQLVAWHSGRTSVFGRRTFPVLRSTCSWWVTIYVGKPSAIGQPTRPTQPFIPSGSIDE